MPRYRRCISRITSQDVGLIGRMDRLPLASAPEVVRQRSTGVAGRHCPVEAGQELGHGGVGGGCHASNYTTSKF